MPSFALRGLCQPALGSSNRVRDSMKRYERSITRYEMVGVGMDRTLPAVVVRRGEGAQRADMAHTFSISRLHFLKLAVFCRGFA